MPAHLQKMHDREEGFTLVELLIVVLIIGILAAVAIPVYLGIQQQGYKAAIKSDVNLGVKRVQVALTEGASIDTVKANYTDYLKTSVKGESLYPGTSPTAGASGNDFTITGTAATSGTPAGPVNYTYMYDSATGKFTESDTGFAFGSASPSIVISTSSLPDGVKDSAYSAQIAVTATNTTGTTQYSATGLPSGWNINANTGVISGTPSAVGTLSNIVITATNGSLTTSRTYSISVNAKPAITTNTLPNAVANTAYSQTLNVTGTPAPTRFDVATGALPTGLTLSNTGVISGTPTVAGSYSFTITATNTAGTSPAQAYVVTVGSVPTITTANLPNGTTGANYSQTIATTGSPAPTFTATGLPTGLSIDANTGAITGVVPDGNATDYTVTTVATNSFGSNSKTYTLKIGGVAKRWEFAAGDTQGWVGVSGASVTGKYNGYETYLDVVPATNDAYAHAVAQATNLVPNGSYTITAKVAPQDTRGGSIALGVDGLGWGPEKAMPYGVWTIATRTFTNTSQTNAGFYARNFMGAYNLDARFSLDYYVLVYNPS